MVLLNKLKSLRAGCIYADLLGNKFWQVRMVCFYVNLHKFCTKSRLFLFGPFSRSSIFASEIAFLAFFPYRVLLQIHSYNFGFCNISQIWLYLHSLIVQISLYLFCDVKNSQFLDLCSKITNRRQIDEKQPTWILSLGSVRPKWRPLLRGEFIAHCDD